MVNCWKLWVPCQAVNFSVVPVQLRVPFAAGVSFVCSCVLSALRGEMKPIAHDQEPIAAAQVSAECE